jgi:two-component system alkaline phosphatase synthesis response regulator PhoP
MKIMLVDDEPDVLLVERIILEKAGYEVIETESGEECLERLETEKPDVILLDIMMPGIDGWETCKRIKENESTKDIPVIMVTVRGSEEDMTKSFQYSMSDGHVVKPIIKEKLLKTIEWIVKTKGIGRID